MYERIIRSAMQTPWAITPDYAAIIQGILVERAMGLRLSKEELQARIGTDMSVEPLKAKAGNGVMVIPIYGVIAHRTFEASSGMMSAETILAMVKRAKDDDEIGTVLFDVSSPGGTVEGVPETAQAIAELSQAKRTVAIANAQMCSAAYWLASQAREIVGIPSATSIGAIGVFTIHEDISKALNQKGIQVTIVSAGKRKVDGNPFEPMTDEMKAMLQTKVDAMYGTFVRDVAKGRSVTPAAVRAGFGEGAALNAAQAREAGLIDRIATFDDTLARLVGGQRSASRARVMAATSDAATITSATCPDCGGTGVQPESYMGDPKGQQPCSMCQPVTNTSTAHADDDELEPGATYSASHAATDDDIDNELALVAALLE